MYEFHTSVHARPRGIAVGESVVMRGLSLSPLVVGRQAQPLGLTVSFEQAERTLSTLPRLFFEPDGSFVWVGEAAGEKWQVDGELYDGGGTLAYVELRGRCPAGAFDQLLRACGWPDKPLMFQLMREAVYLQEADFRQYAGKSE